MILPAGSTPSAAASLRSRRVSSAAITGALASAWASSGDASPGRPMGTAATVRVPVPVSLVFMPGTTLRADRTSGDQTGRPS